MQARAQRPAKPAPIRTPSPAPACRIWRVRPRRCDRCWRPTLCAIAPISITGFLTHHPASVTVIDPKIPAYEADTLNGAPCRLRHVAAKLQEVEIAPAQPYGLVLLGLSLKPFGRRAATPPELLALAAGAAVLVIDYALELERALGQIGALTATRSDLSLTIHDEALRAAGFDRRRFLVYGDA